MKSIELYGVKQNNLKNIDIKIPLQKLTVICGPSGSGKSSLAFETLFAEGQRRFIESLSNYARQFIQKSPRPDLDSALNLPPAIALEQKNGIRNSRSTVGSMTEIYDYLRLLFDKIAEPYCPTHNVLCHKHSSSFASKQLFESHLGKRGYLVIPVHPHTSRTRLDLHAWLLQQGYLRVLLPSKTETKLFELSDPKLIKKGLPKSEFYLVIDRFEVTMAEAPRIGDSMEQAYLLYKSLHDTTDGTAYFIFNDQIQIYSEKLSCPICQFEPIQKSVPLFNSNSPMGACPRCKGFGNTLELDINKIIPDPTRSIQKGAIEPFSMPSAESENKELLKFCKKQKILTDVPWSELSEEQKTAIWKGNEDFIGVEGLFRFLDTMKYKMHVRVFISRYRTAALCPDCHGNRLRPEAYSYQVHQNNWVYFSKQSAADLKKWFAHTSFSEHEQSIVFELKTQILNRLNYLCDVGLSYLTLERETRTLSGGEYQRMMLSNQLGMELSQALYILDEPTIGLHPKDNLKLIQIIKRIRDIGNTLVVVEHDEDVIKSSDYVIEIGPGSGLYGGEVLFSGTSEGFLKSPESLTSQYIRLAGQKDLIPLLKRPIDIETYKFKINLKGCQGHNLKNIDASIPLNRFVVISGVSGSGKSTLIRQILYPALANYFKKDFARPLAFSKIDGTDYIKDVVLLDQASLSKNARSLPITYLKLFDRIRDIFASQPQAKLRNCTPGSFSLNVDGGRCPACKGSGVEEVDLVFMDNVVLTCEECGGKRYKDDILNVTFQGRSIVDVLNMTVEEAGRLFSFDAQLHRGLNLLKEVGLSYLKLGQSTSSLSGGEAQRLKIAFELLGAKQKQTLYILDEPTTGLHFREVDLLIKLLQKLVDSGASILIIEHNLRVIQSADWVIELGPEGGEQGGYLIAQGTPEQISQNPDSVTGPF